MDALGVVYP
jgi:hypothetical protein